MDGESPSNRTDFEQTTKELKHLNPFGLVIRETEKKGRGVFATQPIPSGTVVDISPVLLFPKENYVTHAKHTIVDDYAFVWGDGQMALAMGLGSMMNHDESPNVSYSIFRKARCIKFTTMKPVKNADELCIYYGSKLWFPSEAEVPTTTPEIVLSDQEASVLPSISLFDDEDIVPPVEPKVKALANEPEPKLTVSGSPSSTSPSVSRSNKERKTKSSKRDSPLPLAVGNHPPAKDIVPPEQLPFERFKFPDEDVVEPEDGPIPTMDIWATNVSEPRKIGLLLEHIRLNSDSYRTEALDHLKRIRRVTCSDENEPRTQLALSPHSESSPGPPSLPPHLSDFASSPFVVTVPSTHAVNQIQLTRKNLLWPVCYYPMLETKKEKEWAKQEVEWMREGVKKAIEAAREAKKELGELPIAAYVTTTFDPEVPASTSSSWTDYDTRNSTHHPLRHACMNIIRKVASSDSALPASSSTDNAQQPSYLLTGRTLFITHEPCIMCCMALLHSRVKDVVYIKPMPRTGGLGGANEHKALVEDSVPGLKGVNHRFGIWRWIEKLDGGTETDLDQTVDA